MQCSSTRYRCCIFNIYRYVLLRTISSKYLLHFSTLSTCLLLYAKDFLTSPPAESLFCQSNWVLKRFSFWNQNIPYAAFVWESQNPRNSKCDGFILWIVRSLFSFYYMHKKTIYNEEDFLKFSFIKYHVTALYTQLSTHS